MKKRLRPLFVSLAMLAAALIASSHAPASGPSAAERLADAAGTRPVDIVIVLDTSGSMGDLLDATRARIWDVVNTLARLQPAPDLRVGLIAYGTERATEAEGWIVVDSPLQNDLDSLYGALMALETAGGEELVGRALFEALDTMAWSPEHDALKIVFVAGNESADQGVETHDFRTVARWARDEGIFVNALYAGNRDQAIVELWPDLARAGGGSFASIDPERSTIQIPTPQDAPLLALNAKLNDTYLPYGPEGANGLANQVAQDSNASRLGVEACSSRIVAKGSALYTNAGWDLVDATSKGVVDLATISPEDLPPEMRPMTTGQMASYVQEKRSSREALQEQIQELSTEREKHIRTVVSRERMARGLDAAMKDALVGQAREKGFQCGDC